MADGPRGGFAGRTIVALESRRADAIAELIRRYGGRPLLAPSMREVPLLENEPSVSYLRQLEAREIDATVFLTGVGLRALIASLEAEGGAVRLADALRGSTVIARGPKPVAVLREMGLTPQLVAPEPNTWRELLALLDADWPVSGKRIAVQEYGLPNRPLIEALEARGAVVSRLPVYRWALPDDLEPLRRAIAALLAGAAGAALFTSATQVFHLFQVAGADADALRSALNRTVVASVGPICSEALAEHGVSVRYEPDHPKMGQLVGGLARTFSEGVLKES